MKQSITLIALSIFLSSTGYSQDNSTNSYKWGIHYEVIGKYNNDLVQLNNTLKTAGIGEINNGFLGFSIGTYSRPANKKSYATANLTWLGSQSHKTFNDSITSRINVFELSTEMHWVVSNNINWYLYPYYGFGMSISHLKIREEIPFKQSITDLSNQQGYISEFPLFFANLGVGIDRFIKIQKFETFIGLNFGYRFSTKSGWGYIDSPSVGYSGFAIKARVRIEIENLRKLYR